MKKLFSLILFIAPILLAAQTDSTATNTDTVQADSVHNYATEMPEYPGGEEALFKFIKKETNYPSSAIKKNAQGIIKVAFIVEKDGSLSNIRTVGNVFDEACAKEAVRVVSRLKKFKPAKQDGEPVRLQMVIPINFKIK